MRKCQSNDANKWFILRIIKHSVKYGETKSARYGTGMERYRRRLSRGIFSADKRDGDRLF